MELMRVSRVRMRCLLGVALMAGLVAVVGASFTVVAHAGGVVTGEEVYAAQKCSVCHSVGGKGNKKYPLDGVGSRLSEADIREWLINPDAQQAKKTGRPLMRMPSYRSLPPEDIDALVGYLKAL
jgi:mono/diheme cytochrome c family protein